MIESKFSLELTKGGIQKTITAKSGEKSSRVAVITLTESGKVFDASPFRLRVCLDSGESVSSAVTYERGCVRFTLPEGMLVSPGAKVCELQISNDAHTIYSPMFKVLIEKSIGQQITEDVPFDEPVQYQEIIPNLDEGDNVTLDDEVALFSDEKTTRNKLSSLPFETKLENKETLDLLSKDGDKLLFNGKSVAPDAVSQLNNDKHYVSEGASLGVFKNDIGFASESFVESEIDKAKQYADETVTKTISSTKVSAFDNDAEYVAQYQLDNFEQEKVTPLWDIVIANTNAKHTHDNKTDVLDKLSLSASGALMLDGELVSSGGGSSAELNPSAVAAQIVTVMLHNSILETGGVVYSVVESVDKANTVGSNFQGSMQQVAQPPEWGGSVLVFSPTDEGDVIYIDPMSGDKKTIPVKPGVVYTFYGTEDPYETTHTTATGIDIRKLLLNGVIL